MCSQQDDPSAPSRSDDPLRAALERIVAIHAKAPRRDDWDYERCTECSGPWRCPTRQTAERALAASAPDEGHHMPPRGTVPVSRPTSAVPGVPSAVDTSENGPASGGLAASAPDEGPYALGPIHDLGCQCYPHVSAIPFRDERPSALGRSDD